MDKKLSHGSYPCTDKSSVAKRADLVEPKLCVCFLQCCGAGASGADIILGPGAGAEIMVIVGAGAENK